MQLALQPSSLHFAVHEVSVSSQVLVHIVSVSFAFSSTLGFETLAVHPIAADPISDARTRTLLWNLVIFGTPLQKGGNLAVEEDLSNESAIDFHRRATRVRPRSDVRTDY